MESSRDYVFILRGWQEGSEWRWSLLSSSDKRRLGFADLDGLYLYLASLMLASEEDKEAGSDASEKQST